jgi:PilZ domain
VHDISAGGCLLEAQEPLPVGTVGRLSMDLDGRRCEEWIRVCRVHAEDGPRGTCFLSVEFLPLEPAGTDSLRGAMLRLRAVGSSSRFLALSGRSSGDPGNSPQPVDMRGAASSAEPHVDRNDSQLSRDAFELAAPLLNDASRARPKPEKE